VRDEKLKVLRALRPMAGADVLRRPVRGQYRPGRRRQPVPGYLDEAGVEPDSTTETFVALKAEIDTWRWAGVPFYLRTGKRLQERSARSCHLRRGAALDLRRRRRRPGAEPARSRCSRGRITLTILAKRPGEVMRLKPVEPVPGPDRLVQDPALDAYERLLGDVVKGNLTLFMRRDELDAAWRWIDPIREGWAQHDEKPKAYTAGSLGARASSTDRSRRLRVECCSAWVTTATPRRCSRGRRASTPRSTCARRRPASR
jgi:glucose-6-phosphate 1-dehydrogenase